MYYYISGTLSLLEADLAVIDCGGVGYMLYISKTTHDEIAKSGAYNADGSINETNIKLFCYLNVREDAMELFGFYTEEEKTLFKQLISVSGIGPKAALSILSALSVSGFLSAVYSDDAKAIASAQGVGLKTAQKVILELKDKLQKMNLYKSVGEGVLEPQTDEPKSEIQAEARDALIVLGYTKNEAQKAVARAKGASTEELIRNALKELMR